MVFIPERNKSKWLQNVPLGRSYRIQHLGHAADVSGLRLKRDLDKVAFTKRLGQVQHSARGRDARQSGFGLVAIAQFYQGLRGCKLNSRSTVKGIDLGIVCHATTNMALDPYSDEIT